ncbi:PREDICTED: uncharacterized protein LOC109580805 [Amphimedon queenslandica]|uniref:Uncharacterized protein n=1 Tax=Amphimedon queenslandica TaxID=400682 RepID=A0A1X7VA29_AMPQE|nr:PREDICTED: uncharacterized protein LOC109580805 [Amphimedon queenslandica]|eukprot:XP_019849915.1 PREDICTED: uncharacterized protein LOC109580805 [Amphimedon queenslandica]
MEGESFGDFEIEVESEISDEFLVILVFGRKYPVPISEQTLEVAWKVFILPTNGKVNFMFPHKSKVGAFYFHGESQGIAGPLDAKIGSTWIAMSSADEGSLMLTESGSSQSDTHSGYVVCNQEPLSGEGCIIYAVLYKEESVRPILSKKCRVGNVVALKPINNLYICVMIPSYSATCNEFLDYVHGSKKVSVGAAEINEVKELLPDCEFTPIFELNLSKYCGHVKINIKVQEKNGGKIELIPSPA